MITKHTPGPWKVIETNYLPHNGDHVADMSNGLMVVPSMSGLGEPLADARLIAAAPDLLETLHQIVEQHGQWNNGIWAANLARAAIAKATEAA